MRVNNELELAIIVNQSGLPAAVNNDQYHQQIRTANSGGVYHINSSCLELS